MHYSIILLTNSSFSAFLLNNLHLFKILIQERGINADPPSLEFATPKKSLEIMH
jgi:hypothetical protein